MIREGSKSFRFSSNLFDQTTRERAWLLYSWCRACDDLADGQTLGHDAAAPADPERRIAFIRETTDRALAGEQVGLAPFDALRIVSAECGIPRRFVDDHLDGFALDAEGWRPQSEDDLLRYCYHVAGAVGCMMAIVMGVSPDEEDTLDRAADLGIASSSPTSPAHRRGSWRRPPLSPASWLGAGGWMPATAPLAAIAERLVVLVADYEASARTGRRACLPVALGGAGGGEHLGAIARKVVACGEGAWDSRTIVHKLAKLAFVLKALAQCGERPHVLDRTGLWTRPRERPPLQQAIA